MSQDFIPKLPIDLAAARAKLDREGGKRLWQSIEELSDTKEYRNFLVNEFPANGGKVSEKVSGEASEELPEKLSNEHLDINRRDVMKLMAASAAMAGLSACTKLPTEKIVPYVRPPEEIIPGRPLFYATSMPQAGVATGLLVESHMGRPTKIEGNSEQPGSKGGTDVFMQASILNLYDPDRLRNVLYEGSLSNWNEFANAMGDARVNNGTHGTGMRILTGTVTSPTLGAQLNKLLKQFPEAKWHQYEPSGGDSVREGTRLAFGKPMSPVYHFEQADVIVSLDADFLTTGPGHTRYTRDFSSRRDLAAGPSSNLNRLYVVEPMPTSTGTMADHRLPLRASEIEGFARQLAAAVGVSVSGGAPAIGKVPADFVAAVGRDLSAHRGTSVVVPGDYQPPFVHALAHAMNAALGNVGKTVVYTESIEVNPVNQIDSIRDLVNDLNAGKVEFLLILGVNPVYTAPADLNFGSAILKAKTRVYSGLLNDETGLLCHWHAPAAHYLESWSDGRAYDGSVAITQPLIAPLYEGHSAHEILALLTNDADKSAHTLIREYWQSQRPEKGPAFEAFWETSLHDGVIGNVAFRFRSAVHERCGQRNWIGDRVPPRPDHRRWRIREQQLASGDSQAGDAAYLGQRCDDQPGHGPADGAYLGRLHDPAARWPRSESRRVCGAGACGQFRDCSLGLWPFSRRKNRNRPGLQRESFAHIVSPVDGPRSAHGEDRHNLRIRVRAASIQHRFRRPSLRADGFRERYGLPPRPGADREPRRFPQESGVRAE
jgi:molybdopterin-containing oxidoreductase family iron-sulfur binding subunit